MCLTKRKATPVVILSREVNSPVTNPCPRSRKFYITSESIQFNTLSRPLTNPFSLSLFLYHPRVPWSLLLGVNYCQYEITNLVYGKRCHWFFINTFRVTLVINIFTNVFNWLFFSFFFSYSSLPKLRKNLIFLEFFFIFLDFFFCTI